MLMKMWSILFLIQIHRPETHKVSMESNKTPKTDHKILCVFLQFQIDFFVLVWFQVLYLLYFYVSYTKPTYHLKLLLFMKYTEYIQIVVIIILFYYLLRIIYFLYTCSIVHSELFCGRDFWRSRCSVKHLNCLSCCMYAFVFVL